jgi:putative pyruvate formate lyase activating enzyme
MPVSIVYNSGGYGSVDTLQLPEDVVDIYMPDAKYGSEKIARLLSHAPDYVHHYESGDKGNASPGWRSCY